MSWFINDVYDIFIDIGISNIKGSFRVVSANIKKEFDSQSVYNKNILKTKIKFHGDEVTDFFNQKILKMDYNHTC